MENASSPKHFRDFGTPANGPLLLAYAGDFIFVNRYSRASVGVNREKAISDRQQPASYALPGHKDIHTPSLQDQKWIGGDLRGGRSHATSPNRDCVSAFGGSAGAPSLRHLSQI